MPNFYKLSKTKQRKLIAQQNKKRAAANKAKMSALTISKPAKFAGFNSGGGGFETAARKTFKNIFELQKDEMYDIEMQVEAAHKMHILTGYSQDLEKEYLRLTGVCHFFMLTFLFSFHYVVFKRQQFILSSLEMYFYELFSLHNQNIL